MPKRKFRTRNFNTEHCARNLWYWKYDQLLWWGDRVLLLLDIHLIVKYKVYPDVPKHAATEVGPEMYTCSPPTILPRRYNGAASARFFGGTLEPVSGGGGMSRGDRNASHKRKADEATSTVRAAEPSWGKRVLPWETW